MWYAAHVIMSIEFADGEQDKFPVYENIFLVRAESDDAAFQRAEQLGREGEDVESSSFRWGGRPARWVFAGVRKLIECRTPDDPKDRLRSGTEVSYSQMVVASRQELSKLAAGEPVTVEYEE